jgi:hypothetical protein
MVVLSWMKHEAREQGEALIHQILEAKTIEEAKAEEA